MNCDLCLDLVEHVFCLTKQAVITFEYWSLNDSGPASFVCNRCDQVRPESIRALINCGACSRCAS